MTLVYQAPTEDYAFLMRHVFGVEDAAEHEEILAAAARFFEQEIAPTNAAGDAAGCRFENGKVRVPEIFHPLFAAVRKAEWNKTADETGLPSTVHIAVKEFFSASNMALGLYFSLTSGARAVIERTGEAWMKTHITPRMSSAEWCGTMCLTEPHCGTDLRQMKTRATPLDDGSYAITGTKIFITGGDQDLTENIIHLVLAKLPDEDGNYHNDISTVALFLVPKVKVDPQTGATGTHNSMSTGGIESKMGIKGSATCVLNFDGAIGYRLGASRTTNEKGQSSKGANMSGMFDMMNNARLGTGLQGIALTERALQNTLAYAQERISGKALDPADQSSAVADPIISHPDIRRILLGMASFTEGARVLASWVSRLLNDEDNSGIENPAMVGALLTPVIKAYLSDRAFESLNAGLQVWGGHGFIADNGIEQLVRDSKILQLYEGANGVQAYDLIARKLKLAGGKPFQSLCSEMRAEAERNIGTDELALYSDHLNLSVDLIEQAANHLSSGETASAYDPAGAAYDFLTMFGTTAIAFMWLRSARAALAGKDKDLSQEFVQRKLVLARYWFERELPKTEMLSKLVHLPAHGLMELPAQAL